MKRFMYASLGILALAAAFHLGTMTAEGPRPAMAGYVDHGAGVVATDNIRVLDELGQVWGLHANDGWVLFEPLLWPPVPVSQIKFWRYQSFITTSDEAYIWSQSDQNWVYLGPWPGGPTPPEKTTWSKVKREFK